MINNTALYTADLQKNNNNNNIQNASFKLESAKDRKKCKLGLCIKTHLEDDSYM